MARSLSDPPQPLPRADGASRGMEQVGQVPLGGMPAPATGESDRLLRGQAVFSFAALSIS